MDLNELNIETENYPKGPLYSLDTSGKFIFLRHGQTNYNKNKGSEDRHSDISLINSELNEVGISQIKESAEKIKEMKLEGVFCSPLARTLQTTYYALENHPQVNEIVVKVHPLLSETVNSSQDYISDIQSYKEKFNMQSKVKYDWSIFDKYFPDKKIQDAYVLQYIDDIDDNLKEKLIKEAYDNYENKEKFKEKILGFSILANERGRRLESVNYLFKRTLNFRRFFADTFKDTLNDKSSKVLVVTHSCVITTCTSEQMYTIKEKVFQVPDGIKVLNGQLLSIFAENA